MEMCDINDDVFLYHIFPYINYKDRYSVSFVNKLFNNIFKVSKQIDKTTNIDIYYYFTSTILFNITNNIYILTECILYKTELTYVSYTSNIKPGIYFYSKSYYYQEYLSILDYSPWINIHSHDVYLIIFITDENVMTYMITKLREHILEKIVHKSVTKFNDILLKLY